MADWSGSSQRDSSSRGHRRQASVDYEDLEGEDAWSAVNERGVGGVKQPSRGSTAPRMIPRANPVAYEARTPHRSSAPVNIPDWPKVYGKSNRKVDGSGSCSNSWSGYQQDEQSQVSQEEEEEEDGIVPPHEWIARKLARSQISSSSMCEGKGRTLKGRDLSQVRNAILSKTGFLE